MGLPRTFHLPWRRVGGPDEGGRAAVTTEAALREAVVVRGDVPGPEVRREGDEVVAIVPFEGSAEDWTHYALEQPRGIAVNLPNARSALALGRHTVGGDGFRWVWIRQHERGGIQVRFTLAYRTPKLRGVEIRDGLIRVRVSPAGLAP